MHNKDFPGVIQLMTLLLNSESMFDYPLLRMKSNSSDDVTT